jgi:membrane-associated phospholipid phosphatase
VRPESKRGLRLRVVSILGTTLVLLADWLAVRGHGVPGIDRRAFDALALADDMSNRNAAATLVEASKVALAGCALVGIIWLLVRRAWRDCAVIVAGLIVAQTAAHIAKAQIARPRPAHPLVYAGGYSFPSTTSAIGVAFLLLAIAAARLLPERHRLATVAGGAAVTVLIGLSFVVLRVHYLTDVIAGWALGWLAFTLCESLATVGAAAQRR